MNASLTTRLALGLLLAAATLVAFWPVLGCGFVNYDDDVYVTRNHEVQAGLTMGGLRWALTTSSASNWHPLTWISHMLDWEIWGASPRGHHLTSLLLHLANVLLLFTILGQMTGSPGRSAFAAALFAVHPLRVESVAWIAERKDVLSALFWMLATLAYVRYARKPSAGRYLSVFALMAAGLACKPMLVTLPLALLLLDFWPLGRFADAPGGRGASRLVLEKLPLLALSVASGVVTILVQRADAVISLRALSPSVRGANAAISYLAYLAATAWPRGLAVFYPHPGPSLALSKGAAAALLLAALTVAAVAARRRFPYLLTGWLWYVVTLLPVVGLVQVGEQARADRYTYLPLVGVFIAVAWGIPELFRALRPAGAHPSRSLAVPAVAILLVLVGLTRAQAERFRDSITLFEHALAVTSDNYLAHNNLGWALWDQGRKDEAKEQYEKALAIRPAHFEALNNLGVALAAEGRIPEALARYAEAERLRPDDPQLHVNLGNALARAGRTREARDHLERAVRLDPRFADARYNLGLLLAEIGSPTEALREYDEALRLAPAHAEALNASGILLAKQKRLEEAVARFQRAAAADPLRAGIRANLGMAQAFLGRWQESAAAWSEALRLEPGNAAGHSNLAVALFNLGRYEEAWSEVAAARRGGFEPPEPFLKALAEKRPEPVIPTAERPPASSGSTFRRHP